MQIESWAALIETEADLVERARRRDPQAVRALTTRYNRRLFRIARSILHHDDEAEDVVQAAYLKAFTGLATFDGRSAFGTWLTRILINEALGQLRRRRPLVLHGDDGAVTSSGEIIPFPIPSGTADPERGMAQRQIQVLIERAIDELPAPFRTVLVARVVEEMSLEETADLLGLKPETVKTRLHRARALLRRAIERQVGPLMLNAFPFDGWRCERMTQTVLRRLGLIL